MKRDPITKFLILVAMCLFLTGMTIASTYAADCPAGAICRDENPGIKSGNGPYGSITDSLPRTATPAATTVYIPRTAQPPFAGIVFCPPFTIQRSGFAAWGPWFASHGIVLVTMNTRSTMDYPDSRANQQAQVLKALRAENSRPASKLYNKLDVNRIGAMGWSMGGGATWINSSRKNFPVATAMSLAGHNMTAVDFASKGGQTRCPILIMNGATDMTILGGLGQSIGVYRAVPAGIPKAIYEVATAGHMVWGAPSEASPHVAELALAFQKTFLDGDLRWAQYITRPRNNVATWQSANIP